LLQQYSVQIIKTTPVINLVAYITAVKDDVISGLRKQIKLNMSGDEEQAMQQLLNDDDIVICLADKGSGIVVMDKKEYVGKLDVKWALARPTKR